MAKTASCDIHIRPLEKIYKCLGRLYMHVYFGKFCLDLLEVGSNICLETHLSFSVDVAIVFNPSFHIVIRVLDLAQKTHRCSLARINCLSHWCIVAESV